MSSAHRLSDHLYDVGFFLVEMFAAMEVTAVVIANARITSSLGLKEEWSSLILNSYLFPLFGSMILALAFSRWIARRLPPIPFFMAGLVIFTAGNFLCAQSSTSAHFFLGRGVMGLGGGVAFAGQLWTLSSFHYQRITRPLVWGEIGAALGVVAGPIVGALFVHHSDGAWRHFFHLNGGLGLLTACFALAGLHGREAVNFESLNEPAKDQNNPISQSGMECGLCSHSMRGSGGTKRPRSLAFSAPAASSASVRSPLNRYGQKLLWSMTAWQVAVSILIVGAEYFFSDHLQAKAGKSPLFVGMMTVLASAGAIVGSLWAAHLEPILDCLPFRAAVGLLVSLAALGFCLATGHFLLAGVPIFGAGLGMGLASVSIYASIVKASRPDQFLSRSMIYLIGMQIGNALGVQAVGLGELKHASVLTTTLLVAALPILILLGQILWGTQREA